MKIIIAGSRKLNNIELVSTAIVRAGNYWMVEDPDNWKFYLFEEIISGGAHGVDFLAELYAKKKTIPFKEFPANWNELGKKAGYIRNIEMAEYADGLIAIWDGKSKGTFHMITEMFKRNKLVYIQCP